jgi:hypothetical protein
MDAHKQITVIDTKIYNSVVNIVRTLSYPTYKN